MLGIQERADAMTNWKEFISPEGKKYYYNKLTRQSRWEMPEELKKAREVSASMRNRPQNQNPTVQVVKLETKSDNPKGPEANGVEKTDGEMQNKEKISPASTVRQGGLCNQWKWYINTLFIHALYTSALFMNSQDVQENKWSGKHYICEKFAEICQ